MPKHAKRGLPSIIRRYKSPPEAIIAARLNYWFGYGPIMRDRRDVQQLRDSQTIKA